MRDDTGALRVPTSTKADLTVREELAAALNDVLLASGRRPADRYVYQLRRKIECGAATPTTMLLAVSLEEAAATEVPIGQVTEVYRLVIALCEETRRVKRASQTGQTHAIAGPSLVSTIKRENRAEYGQNTAEDDVIENEDDVEAIDRLIAATHAEQHETERLLQRLLK